MAAKQLAGLIGALSFLGTVAVLAVLLTTIVTLKLLGEDRLSRWSGAVSGWLFGGRGLTRKLALLVGLLLFLYATALVGSSAASREWALSPGAEKYFCEIDCHLAYSVVGVEKVQTIGAGSTQKTAHGTFFVVSLRTRFDEHTISPNRGDSPLTPSPRTVTLVDSQGREYPVSPKVQQSLDAALAGRSISLTTALRPGESYISKLVFDLPPSVSGLKLLVASTTAPPWLGHILIGDEGSILHKKVYLRLNS
jgi:uncharacterized protein DUF4352